MNKRMICLFVIFLLCVPLLFGCAKEFPSDKVVCFRNYAVNPLKSAAENILYDYEVKTTSYSFIYHLDRNEACEALDVQALPAVKNGIAAYWYPLSNATVVIAVDRDATDISINDWSDLCKTECDVGFLNNRFILAAISYALDKESYMSDSAIKLLAGINAEHRLKKDDMSCPIIVCFDYQAAALNAEGRNYELIIPADGTLSYEVGILSNTEINFPDNMNDILINCGLDGESEDGAFPSLSEYKRAGRVSDYNAFENDTAHYASVTRRNIFNTRLYSSADQIEHHMFAVIYCVIAVVWIGMLMSRIVDKKVRFLMLASGMLSICWVLLRYLKYQILGESALIRYLWYLYYVFQLGLPLCMLLIALFVYKEKAPEFCRIAEKISIGLCVTLVICVLTNDMHNFVFIIDYSVSKVDNSYIYGWLYYIIFADCILSILLSEFLLLKTAWSSPKRRGFVLPMLYTCVLIIYCTLYVLGIPFARESDFVMTVGVFLLLYNETLMRLGIIPVNSMYTKLFSHSTLNILIADENKAPILYSSVAESEASELSSQIEAIKSSCKLNDDTVLFTDIIPGGIVVWQEDISEINRLQVQYKENLAKTEVANTLLSKEMTAKANLASIEEKSKLANMLQMEISDKAKVLSGMLTDLENESDKKSYAARITMLLCYIKRHISLSLRKLEESAIPSEDLVAYIDELTQISSYGGVYAKAVCDLDKNISSDICLLVYDFLYRATEACVKVNPIHLLIRFLPYREGIMLDILSPVIFDTETLCDSVFTKQVESFGGRIDFRKLDDAFAASLKFPKEGELNV